MWSVWLVLCDYGFHSVHPLMKKDKRLMEASWWERLRGKLGLVLMGGAKLSKSLIQLSVDWWGCALSLFFDLRPNYGRGNEDNGDFLQKDMCMHCCIQCPWPCNRPLFTLASTGDSWTLTGTSGSVSCGTTAPFFWVLGHRRFCWCPPRVFPQPCVVL